MSAACTARGGVSVLEYLLRDRDERIAFSKRAFRYGLLPVADRFRLFGLAEEDMPRPAFHAAPWENMTRGHGGLMSEFYGQQLARLLMLPGVAGAVCLR